MTVLWTTVMPAIGALAFAMAILLLDAFDISMPRGDSIGVAGALVGAAVLCIGPWWAVIVGAVSVALVQSYRHFNQESGTWNELWIRLAAALASVGAWALLQQSPDWAQSMAVVVVPAAFLLSEIAARQAALALTSGRSFRRLVAGNMSRQSMLFASEVSVAALTAILYRTMGVWTLVPVLALLMLIRQSYATLLEIRETYLTTVSVLIDAAESPEPGRNGHSERVAEIARSIGARCGLRTADLERLSYAALLHDVHGIADSAAFASGAAGSSAEVIQGVGFLSDVVPILRVIDGVGGTHSERDLLSGMIVALASDVDSAERVEVATSHAGSAVARVAASVPLRIKARVVSAAVALGYPVPAID